MIIKGSSRANPRQLAAHLTRTDTNERVTVLELHSPLGDLTEAFRDWQCLAAGTRGTKGLYHANIDPDAKYPMTEAQWLRSVDVLEKELGFEGQPRAVVMHEKHGRQHIHVVWQRTDIDSMTLKSDSWNYRAHERASYQLEEEFGHEHVPGKHDKRDKSQDMPDFGLTMAEWQQAERAGVHPKERKAALTELFKACDSGQALKAALREEGYVLAQGDRRDFVIVDERGDIHSLARQIDGVKAKDLREFMKDIEREQLPSIEQAQALQETQKHQAIKQEQQTLDKALKERAEQERKKLTEIQASEAKQLKRVLSGEAKKKLDALKELHHAARMRLRDQLKVERDKLMHKVDKVLRPQRAKQAEDKHVARLEALQIQHQKDRDALTQRAERDAAKELKDLSDKHAQQLRVFEQKSAADRERYVREQETARRLLEEQERLRKAQALKNRDGPEHKPKLTR